MGLVAFPRTNNAEHREHKTCTGNHTRDWPKRELWRDFQFPVLHIRSRDNYILISKKLRILRTNNSSWIHKNGEDTGQTAVPKTGETDRQIQGVTACYRDSQVGISVGRKI